MNKILFLKPVHTLKTAKVVSKLPRERPNTTSIADPHARGRGLI